MEDPCEFHVYGIAGRPADLRVKGARGRAADHLMVQPNNTCPSPLDRVPTRQLSCPAMLLLHTLRAVGTFALLTMLATAQAQDSSCCPPKPPIRPIDKTCLPVG